jgi:hypothetical protein
MRRKICVLCLIIIIGSLLFFQHPVFAVDCDFQPRIETGVMSYSFEQSANSESVPSGINNTSGYNQTREEIEFNTTMGFVSAGAALFVNRLFVDLSGQYTLEGSDHMTVAESEFYENESNSNLSTYTSTVADYDAQLDRSDHAVSVGYAINKQFCIFAGYKWAMIDLDTTIGGSFSMLAIDNMVLNGQITGSEDVEFKYEGPFIGVAHGWQIDAASICQGLMSVNAGLAHLNSKLSRRRSLNLRVESMNGQDVEPVDMPPVILTEEIKGVTLGLTLGLNWRGTTPFKTLSYSLGISGHRYQFHSDDSISPDISETVVRFKFGLTYVY